jgi:hypothetical protein
MIGDEHRGTRRRSQSLAQLERDAALERVSRTRRWVIAGAAALTAAFAALVSAIAPGRTLGAGAQAQTLEGTRASARAVTATQMPPLASPADLGLQGPSQAPQAASSPSQQAAPGPTQQVTPSTSQPVPAAPPAPVSGGS